MIKICYVVTIPLTIKAFFIPQLQYLTENGFDVSVICSYDEELKKELGDGVRYIPVDMPRGLSVIGSVKSVSKLYEIFKKEKFDIVQYSTPNAALYASIAAKKAGIRVRNYHLMGLRYLGAGGIGRLILKTIEKTSCRLSTSIECVSNSNLELGISEGLFEREKATVVWNGSTGGVDLNRFDFSKREIWRNEIRNEYGLDEKEYVIGFVGRITKDKGINELLEAYFALENEAKLMLIGNDEGIETINQELWQKAKSSENVIFIDFTNEIEKYYPAFDVLVLPSYREGFGNVIIEAGAMGTPSIVSNIPGPVDAIEVNKTGLIVNKCDYMDLKNKLDELITSTVRQTPDYCNFFISSHFDSSELCKQILNRKLELYSLSSV